MGTQVLEQFTYEMGTQVWEQFTCEIGTSLKKGHFRSVSNVFAIHRFYFNDLENKISPKQKGSN
jgi:hypothetical protein